jgi:PadR family transcriptional regulator AphA
MLLVKLALLHRAGSDPSRLIDAQEARLAEQVASLSKARDESVGFERVVVEWRLSSSRATLEFLQSFKGRRGR